MSLDLELLAAECACTRLEYQVEDVFGVDGQTAQLGAVHIAGLGDSACLAAIAVQGEAAQLGGSDVNGVPL